MSDPSEGPIQGPRASAAVLAARAARILRACAPQLSLRTVRAAGPGGQNVNKVSTAVQLRFDVDGCSVLARSVKRRLLRLGGKRVTAAGVLIIQADAHRSQLENRKQAIRELTRLLARSLPVPRARVPTRPTKSARENRLRSKKLRSLIKRSRNSTDLD